MADNANGGTPEPEDKKSEGKTYTDADITAMIAKARADALKEGEVKGYRHWQSEVDKLRNRSAELEKATAEARRAAIEKLPPDERRAAMIEEVYNRLTAPAANQDDAAKDTKDDPKTPAPTQTDAQAAAQARLTDVAKRVGLDPSKLDFASEEGFYKSIIAQARKDEKDEKDDDKAGGPVDKSLQSGGSSRDIRKTDPMELIRSGAGSRVQRRGIGSR